MAKEHPLVGKLRKRLEKSLKAGLVSIDRVSDFKSGKGHCVLMEITVKLLQVMQTGDQFQMAIDADSNTFPVTRRCKVVTDGFGISIRKIEENGYCLGFDNAVAWIAAHVNQPWGI